MQNTDIVETADTNNVAKTVAKELIIATAITAGALVGAVAIGMGVDKVKSIRAARAAKKATDNQE